MQKPTATSATHTGEGLVRLRSCVVPHYSLFPHSYVVIHARYQSQTTYFPEADFVLSVATNVETTSQATACPCSLKSPLTLTPQSEGPTGRFYLHRLPSRPVCNQGHQTSALHFHCPGTLHRHLQMQPILGVSTRRAPGRARLLLKPQHTPRTFRLCAACAGCAWSMPTAVARAEARCSLAGRRVYVRIDTV